MRFLPLMDRSCLLPRSERLNSPGNQEPVGTNHASAICALNPKKSLQHRHRPESQPIECRQDQLSNLFWVRGDESDQPRPFLQRSHVEVYKETHWLSLTSDRTDQLKETIRPGTAY